jgi:hypothetical protein
MFHHKTRVFFLDEATEFAASCPWKPCIALSFAPDLVVDDPGERTSISS